MKRAALIAVACLMPIAARSETPALIEAVDGVNINGAVWTGKSPSKGVVLLFHMAGSNLGEYATIAPRLAEAGYDVLAIDQRSGGDRFGRRNETVRALGRSTGFQQALPDLEAALAHAGKRFPGKPLAVWGSSYSASLVFLLAAAQPDRVKAVLAFSPGEYFGGSIVRDAAAKVKAPVFVTSASDPGEIAEAKALLAAAPSQTKVQYIPRQGVHGSSTLRPDINGQAAETNWQPVERFLASALR